MTQTPAKRKRLDQPDPEELAARRGCMRWGAILGIAVGVVVAFFVMPPLMGHFFGEANVLRGETYDADGKTVKVVGAPDRGDDGIYEVRLEVQTNKTWTPRPEDFKLKVAGVEKRLTALAPDPAIPETSLDFALAEPRTLVLRFRSDDPGAGASDLLYFADPRVRFELREAK